MIPFSKPSGLTPEYAAQFKDRSIVQAYRFREPYSAEALGILARIAGSREPRVLDLGCGCGDLTLGLSESAASVDAVDISTEMLSEARKRAHGKGNITWHESTAEDAPVSGPYDLITSAQSFHWMDWQLTSKRIRAWLRPGRYFALVAREYADRPWWNAELQAIINRYSTNREFQPYELVTEVRKSGLFTIHGDEWTKPMAFQQPVADLVESFHSRNGFSRDRMTKADAEAFDSEATRHLAGFARNGILELTAVSRVTWMRVN